MNTQKMQHLECGVILYTLNISYAKNFCATMVKGSPAGYIGPLTESRVLLVADPVPPTRDCCIDAIPAIWDAGDDPTASAIGSLNAY